MKIAFVIVGLIFSMSVLAMTHFLTDEWYKGGDHFCKYDNGTVLNVGVNICPMSI